MPPNPGSVARPDGAARSSDRCLHCGTAVEEGPFCCTGCELAAAILEEAGLEGWYDRRQAFAPRPAPVPGAWDRVEVVERGGRCEARLAVDGLRCASCVWVVERLLQREPGVERAHLSYGTGRARIRWDPARTDLARIAGRIAAIGYRPRPLHAPRTPDRDLLMRLGVATFCALNGMTLTAAVYVGWFEGMAAPWAELFRALTLLLASPVALWSAQPFYLGALRGLAARTLHMDVPVSLAVGLLYGHGLWATAHGADAYLDSLMMLVALLLAGRLLEARGRRGIQEAVGALAAQLPARARRIRTDGVADDGVAHDGVAGDGVAHDGVAHDGVADDGVAGHRVEEVAAEELVPGDRIEVPTGAEIPADGVVEEGRSAVRMALLTGESEPRPVGPGDPVVAGGLVDGPPIRVRVRATGGRSLLGRMAAALETSLERDGRADGLAPWFTGGTLVAAGLAAALAWPLGPGAALERVVAVLVVACPCALALARPLIGAAGLSAAARRGLLLRSVDALETLAEVEEVALDKTGTLTRGRPVVDRATDEALRIAAGLERSSDHPVARAIVDEAIARGIPLPAGREVVEIPGRGISGWVDGVRWTVGAGGPGWVRVEGGGVVHPIRLRDRPRPDAAAAVGRLRALGLPLTVLSGDRAEVAERVGAGLGIPVLAELDPLDKAAWVRSRGRPVLFVGDGLNDGPALGAAAVGIAMGGGASASILAADGVVAEDALGPVAAGLRLARTTRRAIRRSLGRSVAYNLVAVGAAMAGWVNPLVAALAMPLSSLLVVWEAARVGRAP